MLIKRYPNIAFLCGILLSFWWLPFSISQGTHGHKGKKEPMEEIFEHITDKHELHFGAVHFSLPIIVYKKGSGWFYFSSHHLRDEAVYKGLQCKNDKIIAVDNSIVYDFSVTKNVMAMLLSCLLMLLLFIGLAIHLRRQKEGTPVGFWVLPFTLVSFVRNEIARKCIGEENYERFTPYLLTLFFYILFNNILGLFPEGANVTGNISITFTLGFFTFLITNWNGSKHYWKHIFMPPNIPVLMYPIMIPMELLSMTLRPAILAIRLFANMLAGHLILLSIIGVIFVLNTIFAAAVVVPFCAAMVLLKIFVAFIQAYVFTLLSAIAFGQAVKKH